MYVNGSAAVKTAVLCLGIAYYGWYQAGVNIERGQLAQAAREAAKTDYEKCMEKAPLTDIGSGWRCSQKYGSTHQQQQDAAKYQQPPRKD